MVHQASPHRRRMGRSIQNYKKTQKNQAKSGCNKATRGNVHLRNQENNSKRKTNYDTVFVEHKGQLISLISTLPNAFVKESLMTNTLPIYRKYKLIKPEVAIHNHRIDFLLNNQIGAPFYLEVKSVTYVQKGIAKFPDAVTRRGLLHLKLLQELISKGYQTGVLFVCQRQDASSFQPMWERDPHFSSALVEAYANGVKINCITLNISKSEITFLTATNNVEPLFSSLSLLNVFNSR